MKTKRFLSILLSLVLVLGMLPGMSLTAFADNNTTTITPGTDDAKTGTGTMTITLKIKAAQTITADNVTASYGDTNKSVSASVTTPSTGGGAISYAVKEGSGDYIGVASDGKLTIKKVPASGKAYVIVKAAATDDYAETTKEVTVNISTKAMTVSAEDVTVTVDGQPHGITVNVTDPATGATVKYGTEEGTYNLDASPTQTEAGELTVYYQVTADNYTTYTGSAKVTVSAKQTQNITAADVTATYGDTGKSIEASTSGDGTLSYAVKSGDAVTVNETTGALTIVKAGSAVITVTAAENDTYAKATKDVNVTVNTKAMTVTAADVNVTVDGQPHGITVNVTDPASGATVKYGTEEGSYTLEASPTQTEVGEKTVYYQVTADTYSTYTGSAQVTVSAKQTQTISAENVTATYGDTDKKVSATTDGDGAITYAVKDGSGDYIEVNASTGALTIKKVPTDGKAYVTVTAAGTATYEQATKDVTVTINKADPTVTAPTVKTLTYTGSAQELVNAGSVTGGTMYYAVTTENTAPTDDNLYTTSIPTKTNAGTYYVWYKVVGEVNHNDSQPAHVAAKINPVDKTALTTAITEAETYYNSIKDKKDYEAIASKLKTAIDNAKSVAGNNNVTESTVSSSVTTINKARADAVAAVKVVDDQKAAEAKEAADTAAAKTVSDKIDALPAADKVTTADKTAIEAAQKAYNDLTSDQKKKVSADTLKKLTDAETALKEAEAKETSDTASAKEVSDKIDALPVADKVTTADKAAIEAARKAYDALTDDQKKMISEDTLKMLTDAEKALAVAQKKAVKSVTVNTKTVTAKTVKTTITKAGGDSKYVTTIILGKNVKKISKSAFKNYKKAKTLVVKTKKLKRSTVRNSLKGSKITRVKVKVGNKKTNKKYVKKYKIIFTKKNVGKKVKVSL